MTRILRLLLIGLLSLLALVALAAALFAYFLYTPEPELPQLSGTLGKASMEVAGVKRSYRTYVPKGLPKGAPLVLVLHGSGEGPQAIRVGTGYGFERLADQHGFAVAYPKSFGFDWNDCSSIGNTAVDGVRADDAGFLAALVEKLVGELGVDPDRVFAAGVSNGGSMALRLALEHPKRYRAVAAALANVPAPQNFQCQPVAQPPSVMILNGTEDPLVPYAGGEVNLLGLFYKGGAGHLLHRVGPVLRGPPIHCRHAPGQPDENGARHPWRTHALASGRRSDRGRTGDPARRRTRAAPALGAPPPSPGPFPHGTQRAGPDLGLL
ncbi:MAG: prolyl oligopeptidase family serine peptidase [Vitreoscilla sp.]|nr:prolyl oligopeptidase family serine peptidase [Vitreoscilla sp.]